MRALPGRATRTTLADPAPGLTRESVGDAQRRRIRRATGELVAKRGYADVSVELIIKRAKVSYKTFYKHYANKEEAFADLFDHTVAATEAQVAAALAETELPWPEQVALAMRSFFEAIVAEPLIARALPRRGRRPPGRRSSPATRRSQEPSSRSSSRGASTAPRPRRCPQTLEDTLAGAVLWAAYQRLNLSEIDRIAELVPENVELVLRPYVGDVEAARVARESAVVSAGSARRAPGAAHAALDLQLGLGR